MTSIHPAVRVGHIHLSVADLDRSIAFYRDGLGFNLIADGRQSGLGAAFLAAGDYHHHTDHAATVSVYLEDPDGNGVELYYDRPREAWFDEDGRPILQAERIPIESI